MNPNYLWAVWATVTLGGFAALETWALLDKTDRLHPLTYWLRYGVEHFGWFVSIVIGGFVSWFLYHLMVEPLWKNKREDDE